MFPVELPLSQGVGSNDSVEIHFFSYRYCPQVTHTTKVFTHRLTQDSLKTVVLSLFPFADARFEPT